MLSLEAASPASGKIYPGPGLGFRLGGFAPLDSLGKLKNGQKILKDLFYWATALCDLVFVMDSRMLYLFSTADGAVKTLRRRLTTVKFGLAFRLLEEGE
jgi:hypothetical protein